MLFYTLDYTIEKVLRQNATPEQSFLHKFTDEKFTETEARNLFERITDHKWYIGERLKRDVGMKVAAVDYLENFYEPKKRPSKSDGFFKTNLKAYENMSLTA